MTYPAKTCSTANGSASDRAAPRKPEMPLSLRPTDFIVHRLLQSASAPPFLGLLDVSDKIREDASRAIKSLAGRDWTRCLKLLEKYPNFGAWYLCDTVRRSYGSDGTMRVWPDIAVAMGFDDTVPVQLRSHLHSIVAARCVKLGLPVPAEDYVSLFRLHAGVSDAQLPELLRAFLSQQKHYGLPDADDGNALNDWEDQALHFVPHGLTVLRKPILWDMTGWHATLFLDCINGTSRISSKFRQSFDEVITELRASTATVDGRAVIAPKPRLVLSETEIALRLPEGSRRQVVQFDGARPLRVRAGSLLPVPAPLPETIGFGPELGAIDVLRQPGDLLAGDLDAPGDLVRVRDQDSLPMTNVVLFSRTPFRATAGSTVQSQEIAEGLHSASCCLSPSEPLTLVNQGRQVTLRRKLYRRITLRGGFIGRRGHRVLQGPSATVAIQTGFASRGTRLLALTLDAGDMRFCKIETDATGACEMPLGDMLEACGIDRDLPPQVLRLELLRPAETEAETPAGTGVRMRAEVWPGFQARCGAEVQSLSPPENLCLESSSGIALDARGFPCVDTTSAEKPQMAFDIEGKSCLYDLPPDDLSLTHLQPDGSARTFAIGGTILLGPDTRGGAIRVQCEDEEAEIGLPNGRKFRPFRDGNTATISLRAVTAGWLRLHLPDGRHVDLAEFRSVAQFDDAEIKRRFGGVQITARLADQIDAVRAEIEMEMGQSETATIHFGPDRHMHRPPSWMTASHGDDGTLSISLNGQELPAGVWLGQVQVRDADGWHPLQNARGDVLSFILAHGTREPDEFMTEARLARVLGWLDLCHAEESWRAAAVGVTLTKRKEALARCLAERPDGRARLLHHCLSEAWFDTGSSWMPPMHMLHECPSLFEGPVTDFHLAGGALEALAWIDNGRLRDFEGLDPFAFFAFANARQAQESGAKLAGFDAGKLMQMLAHSAPQSQRRWSGRPLLGPDHWCAAHLLLQDRLDQTGFFGEEAESNNGNRSLTLLRIHSSLPTGLPAMPVPKVLLEELHAIHGTLSRILRAFSMAARSGQSRAWCEGVSRPVVLSPGQVLSGIGDLIRLAPELFAFHLLAAELERRTT